MRRASHARLRQLSEALALAAAGAAEERHTASIFSRLASNRLRLELLRWALGCLTKALDYGGVLVNYSCIAIAVFTGAIAGMVSGMEPGSGSQTGHGSQELVHSLDASSGPSRLLLGIVQHIIAGSSARSFGSDPDPKPGPSPGDIAAAVSNCSFYLLTLVYTFTSLLDVSGESGIGLLLLVALLALPIRRFVCQCV